jgi:hypothetical protein
MMFAKVAQTGLLESASRESQVCNYYESTKQMIYELPEARPVPLS